MPYSITCINLTQALDTASRHGLCIRVQWVSTLLLKMIASFHNDKAAIQFAGSTFDSSEVKIGVKQSFGLVIPSSEYTLQLLNCAFIGVCGNAFIHTQLGGINLACLRLKAKKFC